MALALPTGARGKTLALVMTALAVISVWLGAVMPVWDWYDDRAELLRRQTALARRMASLVETLPALRQEVDQENDGANRATAGSAFSNALLTGDTDPLAAAILQQHIEELATKAGVHVGSEEILPGQAEGALHAISVRLTMIAPFHSMVAFLLAMARSDTPMVADELLMRGSGGRTVEDDSPVDTSLTVTAYRSAKADSP
jgi:general secretion pathway protein M